MGKALKISAIAACTVFCVHTWQSGGASITEERATSTLAALSVVEVQNGAPPEVTVLEAPPAMPTRRVLKGPSEDTPSLIAARTTGQSASPLSRDSLDIEFTQMYSGLDRVALKKRLREVREDYNAERDMSLDAAELAGHFIAETHGEELTTWPEELPEHLVRRMVFDSEHAPETQVGIPNVRHVFLDEQIYNHVYLMYSEVTWLTRRLQAHKN